MTATAAPRGRLFRRVCLVFKEAHSLKGASATLGIPGLAEIAREIEERAMSGDFGGLEGRIAALDAEWRRVRAVLDRIARPDQDLGLDPEGPGDGGDP